MTPALSLLTLTCIIVLILCGLTLLGCAFMLRRNAWVGSVRLALLESNWEAYQRLDSYDAMMWRVWVWDVAKFISADAPLATGADQ